MRGRTAALQPAAEGRESNEARKAESDERSESYGPWAVDRGPETILRKPHFFSSLRI